MDSLRSTSGILMNIGKVGGLPVVSQLLEVTDEVYQWYLDDYRDSLRSLSDIWKTIGKV